MSVPKTEAELEQLEKQFKLVNREVDINSLETVVGFDAYYPEDNPNFAVGVMTSFHFKTMNKLNTVSVVRKDYPDITYKSGYFALKELPMFAETFDRYVEVNKEIPDLIVIDAAGLMHPRRVGFACHAAEYVRQKYNKIVPVIGIGKTVLIRECDNIKVGLDKTSFEWVPDSKTDTDIGFIYRTKNTNNEDSDTKIWVSQGNYIDIDSCLDVIDHFAANSEYKTFDIIREPDLVTKELTRQHM